MKNIDWRRLGERISVSRYTSALLLLAFFGTAGAWIVHTNGLTITSMEKRIDESMTLVYGVRSLHPADPDGGADAPLHPAPEPITPMRIGETTRWFARLLYPAGVWYMNTRMGGEVSVVSTPRSKWRYPGGYYLREHYTKTHGNPVRYRELSGILARDPNVQDFVFFMRTALGVVAVLCFGLVLWALFDRFNLAAAAAYASLILGSSLVLDQFRIFYAEAALFAIFNLAAFLCIHYRVSTYRRVVWLGILSAAALSTKPTGILVVVPAFLYVLCNMRDLGRSALARVEVFVLVLASSMVLINWNASSLFEYVNATLWNVWHYQTGHGLTREGGVRFLLRIVRDLGPLALALFLLAMAWFARAPARRLAPVYALGACAVLLVWSFSDAALYASRNLAPVYVAVSLVAALGIGDLAGKLPAARRHARTAASLGLLLVFLVSGAFLVHGMPSASEAFFAGIREPVRRCASIGAIGLPERDLRTLREAANAEVDAFPGIRAPFVLSGDRGKVAHSPAALEFLARNPGYVFDDFARYDCLVAKREGQTKQLTNFLAPKTHVLQARVGDRFFFARGGGGG